MFNCYIFIFIGIFFTYNISAHDKKVVCYYGSWSIYRPGNGKCPVEKIDPTLCTHLMYTFAGLDQNTVKVLDPWNDLPTDGGHDGYNKFIHLKKQNPKAKTLISIGGWNEGSTKYSQMANNAASRKEFAQNAVKFVQKYGFDGLDLDWEYPAQRGGQPSDKEAYIELLKDLHDAFKPHGLLLTVAVAAAPSSASQSYIISKMSQYLDFINIMAYDLNGSWNNFVGYNAPLYPRQDESDLAKKNLNVDACVKYWLNNGADRSKLILGMPLYGRTFHLVNEAKNKPGSPSNGPGEAGKYTREAGMIGYNEILEFEKEYTSVWDNESMVPYMYKGANWITYDHEHSIYLKAKYVVDNNLGGAMVWSVETDDIMGISGQQYILLRSINDALNNEPEPKTTSLKPTTTVTTTTTIKTTTINPNLTTTIHPTPGPEPFECHNEGYFRDPFDCQIFYYCQKLHNGEFEKSDFKCPDGSVFNVQKLICDYPENVPEC